MVIAVIVVVFLCHDDDNLPVCDHQDDNFLAI